MPFAEMPEDFLTVIRRRDRNRNLWSRLRLSAAVTATRRIRPKIVVGLLGCLALGVVLAMSIVGD